MAEHNSSSSERKSERSRSRKHMEKSISQPLSEREKKKQQERYLAILRDLVTQGDNQFCADCGIKGAQWASWNIGSFLCIRCAGIHRNLGVHVSRVKSTTLDIWTTEQLESLRAKGNYYVNSIYEARLPSSFSRPVGDYEADTFIKSKYLRKEYIDRNKEDPIGIYVESSGNEPSSRGSSRASSRASSRSSVYTLDEKKKRPSRHRSDKMSSSSRSRDKETQGERNEEYSEKETSKTSEELTLPNKLQSGNTTPRDKIRTPISSKKASPTLQYLPITNKVGDGCDSNEDDKQKEIENDSFNKVNELITLVSMQQLSLDSPKNESNTITSPISTQNNLSTMETQNKFEQGSIDRHKPYGATLSASLWQ